MWNIVGKYALKLAIWSIGHTDVIAHTISDAKAKNVQGLVQDAATIVNTVQGGQ